MLDTLANSYHTQGNFGRGKFWQTIATGKSYWQGKIWQIAKLKSVHMPNTILVYLWILARKIW